MRQEDLWHNSRASYPTQLQPLFYRVGTDTPVLGVVVVVPTHIPILGIYYDFHRNFTIDSQL
ncbi:MAG: hypothetical protein Unbinned1446contig1005_25 [Prokaryotic dsDNA virus sp.]|nr:MAG: hypothetical protein Unbinned1446contig1005_25 [Prokaryotic dsDNA virus sp.]